MTKSKFIAVVTKKTMKARKEALRNGYEVSSQVHYMHLRINRMVSIDMPALLKAHLFSDDKNEKVGIMTQNMEVVIWVDDESFINVI